MDEADKINELFGRVQAILGLGCLFLLGFSYVLIDTLSASYRSNTATSDPTLISLIGLTLAIIPSVMAVSVLAISAWFFIGRKLSGKDINPATKELKITAEAIKRTRAEAKNVVVFRKNLNDALLKNDESIHVAVLTAEAVEYYKSSDAKKVFDKINPKYRKRIVVLLQDDSSPENTYANLYEANLPNLLDRFKESSEYIFLVYWNALLKEARFHPCLRDCAVFPTKSQHIVFTNYIGESFFRLTKSPFHAYEFNDNKFGNRVIDAFNSIIENKDLKTTSEALMDKFNEKSK